MVDILGLAISGASLLVAIIQLILNRPRKGKGKHRR